MYSILCENTKRAYFKYYIPLTYENLSIILAVFSAVAALSNLGESTDQLSMTLGPGSVTGRDRVTER